MLFSRRNRVAARIVVMLVAILGFSCSDKDSQGEGFLTKTWSGWFGPNKGTDKSGRGDEKPKKRFVTIINKTESDVVYFRVSVANSGVLVFEDAVTVKDNGSLSREIQQAYQNDLELEVLLKDRYDRSYAKNFRVPIKGNTDAPITKGDRIKEGMLKDAGKDLEAWLNKK